MRTTGEGLQPARMNVRTAMVLIGFAALLGCSRSEGKRAEKQYEIVLQTQPTQRERCTELRKVAEAYLRDQSLDEYKKWDLEADGTCLGADIDELR